MLGKTGLLWIMLATSCMSAHAAGDRQDVRLLVSSPPCVGERLGLVTVSLGSKEPNLRTGAPPSVSYKKAFAKLAAAAAEEGGDAVILREHQADYYTKGARRARRPTFILLKGAVVLLEGKPDQCFMALLEPSDFGRDAMNRQRMDVVKDAGVSF